MKHKAIGLYDKKLCPGCKKKMILTAHLDPETKKFIGYFYSCSSCKKEIFDGNKIEPFLVFPIENKVKEKEIITLDINPTRRDWRIKFQRLLCKLGLHKWDYKKNIPEKEQHESWDDTLNHRRCLFCMKEQYFFYGWQNELEPLIILSGRD